MNAPIRLLDTKPRGEKADPALLARLIHALDGRGWVRRKVLSAELQVSDDSLRAAARFSRGLVVGSSTKGYARVDQAPVGDVHRVVAELLSRSRELRLRVGEVLRVLHNADPRAS